MGRLVVDASFQAKLQNLKEQVELCDEQGRVLGRFLPFADLASYTDLEPQVSEEELDRREREEGGRSLAEILADLEKRG